MERIGIIGGTFDPIHYGHLILAEQARDSAALDRVIFVPARTSPFKAGQKTASPEDRLRMVERAIEGNAGFQVSRRELDGPEISYTIETLQAFRDEFGKSASIHFICGTDAFLSMERWKRAEGIFRDFSLVVGARPRYKDRTRDRMIEDLAFRFGTEVTKVVMPKIDISSSDIKERIRTGRSIRYFVPETVENWIQQEGLYRLLV